MRALLSIFSVSLPPPPPPSPFLEFLSLLSRFDKCARPFVATATGDYATTICFRTLKRHGAAAPLLPLALSFLHAISPTERMCTQARTHTLTHSYACWDAELAAQAKWTETHREHQKSQSMTEIQTKANIAKKKYAHFFKIISFLEHCLLVINCMLLKSRFTSLLNGATIARNVHCGLSSKSLPKGLFCFSTDLCFGLFVPASAEK